MPIGTENCPISAKKRLYTASTAVVQVTLAGTAMVVREEEVAGVITTPRRRQRRLGTTTTIVDPGHDHGALSIVEAPVCRQVERGLTWHG